MSKLNYKKAGVDTKAGEEFVKKIDELKNLSKQNFFSKSVYKSPMNFAALMDLSFLKNYKKPLLLSSTDGVGTKLLLAQLFDFHETIGQDLVAMCANDILCSSGKTIQFLDYIACGKLSKKTMESIIKSILNACELAGCVLVGGETAEHPDLMKENEYDLAGFAIGVVDEENLIDGRTISKNDLIIGIPSSGLHSNGYSLVRKIYLENSVSLHRDPSKKDFIYNEILLKPTLIYEPILRNILEQTDVKEFSKTSINKNSIKGIVHITGGGFYENIPRILPENLCAEIYLKTWEYPIIFKDIIQKTNLEDFELFSTFNMGVGMVLVVGENESNEILSNINTNLKKVYPKLNREAKIIGKIIQKSKEDTHSYSKGGVVLV